MVLSHDRERALTVTVGPNSVSGSGEQAHYAGGIPIHNNKNAGVQSICFMFSQVALQNFLITAGFEKCAEKFSSGFFSQ